MVTKNNVSKCLRGVCKSPLTNNLNRGNLYLALVWVVSLWYLGEILLPYYKVAPFKDDLGMYVFQEDSTAVGLQKSLVLVILPHVYHALPPPLYLSHVPQHSFILLSYWLAIFMQKCYMYDSGRKMQPTILPSSKPCVV